ncbi:unnamed protein product [Aureobasidium mustum]|uniref:pyridoxal kinase n=1 Tax=Aureobasidium mustum TaxID=2773714 RepID=A0A9N8PDY9_9PEZI|nr:unnamed protein product [Aureobasidium mustum]
MATFVMQALGCEVSAINTVQFRRKTPAEEVAELYEGLKQSRLNDFDVLLSGYCPSAGVVQQGKIYVSEEVVPAYKSLLRDADLILPNQFEAEYVPTANNLGFQ